MRVSGYKETIPAKSSKLLANDGNLTNRIPVNLINFHNVIINIMLYKY